MKCPKCGYLGFEEADRCRNCSYDFSLVVSAEVDESASDDRAAVRVRAFSSGAGGAARPDAERATADEAERSETVAAADLHGLEADSPQDLPLRGQPFPVLVHETQPPPARSPLAVRRTAIDRPRSRHTTRVVRRASSPLLDVPSPVVTIHAEPPPVADVAPTGLRLAAAAIDALVLAAIDLTVVYLTAQLADVPTADVSVLPLVPLTAFLLGLNVAYLTVFTASGGQTLGKMAMGLQVVPTSGRLTLGAAVVRVLVAVAGTMLAGAGFLPALVRADRRAAHDVAARTRVIRVAS